MEKLTDVSESPRTWTDRLQFALSLLVFVFLAFLAVGLYSYKPGRVSLLNELTGYVLLLGWSLVLFSVLRGPRHRSSPTKTTAADIRENPWEATKSLAMAILLTVCCGGVTYAGVVAFWSEKVYYWPGGRGKPSLYVFWSDSTVLAFAMSLTWVLLGLVVGFVVLRAYWVTNKLPKWSELLLRTLKIK